MSKLDDITKPIFAYGVDWNEHKDENVSVFAGTMKGEMQAQVKQQVKALMLELVWDCNLIDARGRAQLLQKVEAL